MPEPKVYDWSLIERGHPYPGIVRQTIVTGNCTIVRYTYQPGCQFPVHQHPDDQVTIVHSGEIEFSVNGESVYLRAGQAAFIPGGAPHGARVTGHETVVTDNYFASARRAPIAVQTSEESHDDSVETR